MVGSRACRGIGLERMRIIGGRQSWLRMPERLKSTSPYGTGKQAIGSRLGPRQRGTGYLDVQATPEATNFRSYRKSVSMDQLAVARIRAVRDHMRSNARATGTASSPPSR